MGGFLTALGALGPAGIDVGKTWQNYNTNQQQQTNRAAFGKALDALGPDPEFDIARQMFKSGASPEAISQIIGDSSPIGQALQRDWQTRRWQDFVGPDGIKSLTPDKIWEGVGRGVFTPEQAMKYQSDLLKNQIEQAKLDQLGQGKTSEKFNDFLRLNNLNPGDLATMTPDALDKLKNNFETYAGIGPGATTLKTLHNYDTGMDEITAVPAHPTAGKVVGYAKPPVGGNPVAMLNAVQTGMDETLKLLKPYGDSNFPMQLPAELQAHGYAPSKEYVQLSNEIGAVYTTLTTMIMRAGGFRNVDAAQQFMNTHVPRPGVDSPQLIRWKLEDWQRHPNGLMDLYRMMLGNNMYVVPNAKGGLDAVPMPTSPTEAAEPPSDLEDVNP